MSITASYLNVATLTWFPKHCPEAFDLEIYGAVKGRIRLFMRFDFFYPIMRKASTPLRFFCRGTGRHNCLVELVVALEDKLPRERCRMALKAWFDQQHILVINNK
jgi:hypothetical protein